MFFLPAAIFEYFISLKIILDFVIFLARSLLMVHIRWRIALPKVRLGKGVKYQLACLLSQMPFQSHSPWHSFVSMCCTGALTWSGAPKSARSGSTGVLGGLLLLATGAGEAKGRLTGCWLCRPAEPVLYIIHLGFGISQGLCQPCNRLSFPSHNADVKYWK